MSESTILVFEDDAALRRILRDLLEGSGYGVVDTDDPAAAVTAATSRFPDLAVLDVMASGTESGRLATRLREARPGLKVLYISGYSAGQVGGRLGDTAGVFLQKPFREDELLRAVAALLQDAWP